MGDGKGGVVCAHCQRYYLKNQKQGDGGRKKIRRVGLGLRLEGHSGVSVPELRKPGVEVL